MEKILDIIIPTYNAHKTLSQTLCSIVTQSFAPKCVVTIIDDCSKEGYDEILNSFRGLLDINYGMTSENCGPGNARQLGIDATSCPFITFIDADDQFTNKIALEEMIHGMEQYKANIAQSDFIEEVGNRMRVPHKRDFTWMFGKIYRRSFLDKYQIRFNPAESYANEDSGFNTLCNYYNSFYENENGMIYCELDTYIWCHGNETITRENKGAYAFNKGFTGFLNNQAYAIEKAQKDIGITQVMKKQLLSVLVNAFHTYNDCLNSYIHSEFEQQIVDNTRNFYNKFYEIIHPALWTEDFLLAYFAQPQQNSIHRKSIYDFLHLIDESIKVEELGKVHSGIAHFRHNNNENKS